MTLGPWYVGDKPTTNIIVSVTRDGVPVQLDGYATAAVLLYDPAGAPVTWGTTPTIDAAADTVTILPPSASPFATAGVYTLYLRLTTAGGAAETFEVGQIEVLTLGATAWPPSLNDLKRDLKIDLDDTADDERLRDVLDASVTFVQRVRSDVSYVGGTPAPSADLRLGTVRLAARWHIRRRSPDALIQMAEFGSSRVPSFDPDIDRLLKIGRYRGAVFA